MPSNPLVRQAMEDLARTLTAPTDVDETLAALTRAACDTIPGVDCASINLMHEDGRFETLAATDVLIEKADVLQLELREGPCFEAASEDEVFVAEDLAHDPRWPTYGPAVAALGLKAQMGIDLHPPSGRRAALNLYARNTWLFVDAYEVAEMFASQASLILGFARTSRQLHAAIENRSAISKALGIVMERYKIDDERAFKFLMRVSQNSNVKLRDVAADIVAGVNTRNALRADSEPDPTTLTRN